MDKELTVFFVNDSKEIIFYDNDDEVELLTHDMDNLLKYTKDIIKFSHQGYNISLQNIDCEEEYLELTEQYEILEEVNMAKGKFIY